MLFNGLGKHFEEVKPLIFGWLCIVIGSPIAYIFMERALPQAYLGQAVVFAMMSFSLGVLALWSLIALTKTVWPRRPAK